MAEECTCQFCTRDRLLAKVRDLEASAERTSQLLASVAASLDQALVLTARLAADAEPTPRALH